MTSRIAVTGSLAYDFLSQYDQPFDRVLLKDQLHQLSVCFVVPNKERHFGGTAGNIAYNLALLKAPPTLFAGVGYDFKDYANVFNDLHSTYGFAGTLSLFNPNFFLRGEMGWSDEISRFYMGVGYLF